MQTHHGVAHFAFDFGAWCQRSDRVDDDDIDAARAHQHIGDFQTLLAGIRLRNDQVRNIYTQFARVDRIQCVFGINEGSGPPGALCSRDDL